MRLATYNVENLFDRAKAMNLEGWDQGKPILEDFAKLSQLIGQVLYSEPDKAEMAKLIVKLGMVKSDTGPFVILRRNKGGLLKRPKAGGIEIVANGRADWVGSLELRDEPINEHAMRNTARVIKELEADVLGVVEVESRPVLSAFNLEILPAISGNPFRHVMVIDGNDERGIDVGLMAREGYPIGLMRSHVDDRTTSGENVFSRDCPEYEVTTLKGNRLLIMVNHLKSKGYGDLKVSDARRKAQADRIVEIYNERIAQGFEYVAVLGDFNDTPDSKPLASLKASTLTDIFEHHHFDKDGHPGTYGSCLETNKIDYIMLSPKLYAKVQKGGVFRKGMWPGVRPRKWEAFEEVSRREDAASDHAAIWIDIDI